MENLLFAFGGLILGVIIGYFILNVALSSKRKRIIEEAEQKAKAIKQDHIFKAKEQIQKLKATQEEKSRAFKNKLKSREDKLKHRESENNKRFEKVKKAEKTNNKFKADLEGKIQTFNKRQKELDTAQKDLVNKLERITGLSPQEAKTEMMKALKDEAKTDAMAHIREIVEEAKLTADQEARKIVIQSIQRVAAEQAIENSVSVFNIENDDVKGRVIGREGRNIRALEAATGVEVIVDDTPEAIIISCFDPVRREIARLALHNLVSDGRIHPAKIEEVVAKTKKKLEQEIVQTGKRTCIDLGIHGLHPQLTRMVGRMKYRSSYGQNLLQHSREVANLCATMAAELGLNVKLAKRAGLLHDIGKVPDDEPEKPHAIFGMELAKKFGEKEEVCNAIGAHHDEIEMTSLISPIVQVCDAVSGARPGARREIVESYIKRLNDLENLAKNYNGVTKAYAIQAGRELRVMVESEKVSDSQADTMAFELSQKIQTEMTYPGQVKITVIREKRSVSYAK